MTITITLPLPMRCLSPNARCGWRAKARAVRKYREAAFVMGLRAKHATPAAGPWKSAELTCRFFHRDPRRRDPDNLLASLKPAFDGFVDAGILADDSGLIHRPVECGHDPKNPRVEVAITNTEGES